MSADYFQLYRDDLFYRAIDRLESKEFLSPALPATFEEGLDYIHRVVLDDWVRQLPSGDPAQVMLRQGFFSAWAKSRDVQTYVIKAACFRKLPKGHVYHYTKPSWMPWTKAWNETATAGDATWVVDVVVRVSVGGREFTSPEQWSSTVQTASPRTVESPKVHQVGVLPLKKSWASNVGLWGEPELTARLVEVHDFWSQIQPIFEAKVSPTGDSSHVRAVNTNDRAWASADSGLWGEIGQGYCQGSAFAPEMGFVPEPVLASSAMHPGAGEGGAGAAASERRRTPTGAGPAAGYASYGFGIAGAAAGFVLARYLVRRFRS